MFKEGERHRGSRERERGVVENRAAQTQFTRRFHLESAHLYLAISGESESGDNDKETLFVLLFQHACRLSRPKNNLSSH